VIRRFGWIANMVRKDWNEHGEAFIVCSMIPFFLPFLEHAPDHWKRVALVFVTGVIAMYVGVLTFFNEQTYQTLELAVGLPVRPVYVILGKFASVYSVCLIATNLPMTILRDPHFIYLVNAEVLFLATLTTACSLLSDHRAMAFLPFFLFAGTWMNSKSIEAVETYASELAMYGYIATPVIFVVCVVVFWNDWRVR